MYAMCAAPSAARRTSVAGYRAPPRCARTAGACSSAGLPPPARRTTSRGPRAARDASCAARSGGTIARTPSRARLAPAWNCHQWRGRLRCALPPARRAAAVPHACAHGAGALRHTTRVFARLFAAGLVKTRHSRPANGAMRMAAGIRCKKRRVITVCCQGTCQSIDGGLGGVIKIRFEASCGGDGLGLSTSSLDDSCTFSA